MHARNDGEIDLVPKYLNKNVQTNKISSAHFFIYLFQHFNFQVTIPIVVGTDYQILLPRYYNPLRHLSTIHHRHFHKIHSRLLIGQIDLIRNRLLRCCYMLRNC